jgi:hypothetical protein
LKTRRLFEGRIKQPSYEYVITKQLEQREKMSSRKAKPYSESEMGRAQSYLQDVFRGMNIDEQQVKKRNKVKYPMPSFSEGESDDYGETSVETEDEEEEEEELADETVREKEVLVKRRRFTPHRNMPRPQETEQDVSQTEDTEAYSSDSSAMETSDTEAYPAAQLKRRIPATIKEEDEEEKEERKHVAHDPGTFRWEEALRPNDEETYQLCCELSEANERIFDTEESLSDLCVILLGAGYSFVDAGNTIRLNLPLFFVFGEYYSNHYLYSVIQWVCWFSWRAWLQAVYCVYLSCHAESFEWLASKSDRYVVKNVCDLKRSMKHLYHSACLCENLLQDFVRIWPNRVTENVPERKIHCKVDLSFISVIQKANTALCQLIGLLQNEVSIKEGKWTQREAEENINSVILPYHQVYCTLVSLKGNPKLSYLNRMRDLSQYLYQKAVIRYARATFHCPMEHFVWCKLVTYRGPMLLVDSKRDFQREADECQDKFTSIKGTPYVWGADDERFEWKKINLTNLLQCCIRLVQIQPVPKNKFPVFNWNFD